MKLYWCLWFIPAAFGDRARSGETGEASIKVAVQQHSLVQLKERSNHSTAAPTPLALLVAVSGRGTDGAQQTEDADFFKALLPSFLETTKPADGFDYTFYLAYDVGDPFYDSDERRTDFERLFLQRSAEQSQKRSTLAPSALSLGNALKNAFSFAETGRSSLQRRASLRWVDVAPYTDGQSGPVRAWNTAFQEAFSDGAAYFYQLGEDVKLASPDWSSKLVGQLQKQGDIGIAGGRETQYQANTDLMPNVMVPRAHMSIFGTFFPTKMHNWWSDDWILQAYKPFGLASKLSEVEVQNTHADARYQVSEGDIVIPGELRESTHNQVSQYLKFMGTDSGGQSSGRRQQLPM